MARWIGVAVVATFVVGWFGAAGTSGAAPAAARGQAGGQISVSFVPAGVQGVCLPPPLALSRSVHSTDTAFTVHIVVAAPLCEPVHANAVVYAMAGNGAAWPQRLVEATPFTIQDAGTIEVSFTKTCQPVQFDVVTGAIPPVISPLGAQHGPLLFPNDTETSQQHWGWPCDVPDTVPPPTQPPPSSPEPPPSTVGVPPTTPEVLGTTSVVAVAVSATPPAPTEPTVLAAGGPAGEPSPLAFTGGTVWSIVLGAVSSVLAGLSLLSWRQARRAAVPR